MEGSFDPKGVTVESHWFILTLTEQVHRSGICMVIL